MNENIVEIKNLSVIYETDENTVYAVNGLDLLLKKGETLGLVGETGAGKTTTALSILRLLPDRVGKVTGGEIYLNGKNIQTLTEADMRTLRGHTVGMIFQDPMTSLNPIITVGDQIKEVLRLHNVKGLSSKELDEKVDELIELVGIPASRKNEYPHQFSGGMKQRIVIAIALACNPELLIADEPTTALDVTIQAQILKIMRDLKNTIGTSMVLITHDLGIVAQMCDSVAIMYAGEIIEMGTAEDIFTDAKHPYTNGLFNSIPNLEIDTARLQPIDGMIPDPTNLPAGCKFHPRCPKAMEICAVKQPENIHMGQHAVKCHLFSECAKGEVIQ